MCLTLTQVIVSYVFANAAYFSVLRRSDIVDFEHDIVIEGFATKFGTTALGTVSFHLMILRERERERERER